MTKKLNLSCNCLSSLINRKYIYHNCYANIQMFDISEKDFDTSESGRSKHCLKNRSDSIFRMTLPHPFQSGINLRNTQTEHLHHTIQLHLKHMDITLLYSLHNSNTGLLRLGISFYAYAASSRCVIFSAVLGIRTCKHVSVSTYLYCFPHTLLYYILCTQ